MLWRIVVPLVAAGPRGDGDPRLRVQLERVRRRAQPVRRPTATVPVAIAKFAQEYEIKNGVMAAGVVLSVIPAVLLLLFAQRHIVKGLTAGVGR